MTQIIAGVFDDNATADRTIANLHDVGFGDGDIDRFAVNPPGRHNGLPLGGDEQADEGARGGEMGALAGAAVGGAVGAVAGLVATPLIGPVAIAGGLAAGAYAGSLAGAVRSLGRPVENGDAVNAVRQAGVMVAVHVDSADQADSAVDVLRANAARSLEQADGLWRRGHWIDFDPVGTPQEIEVDGGGRRLSRTRRATPRGPRAGR
ncbi:MAG TPA: hypothetical protein VGK44_14885 [Casimicrobiaceae bacterium]|jgi:hypothetical protein